MEPPYKEVTAHHESGQTVVALALAQRVLRISIVIVPNRERRDRCAFGKGCFGRPRTGWNVRSSSPWEGLRPRFTTQAPSPGTAPPATGLISAAWLERRLLAKAEHLFAQAQNWQAVERIAAELLRRGAISGRAARSLYDLNCNAC